ncbi:GNAT family N-acetyltransferase [Devosia sp. CAU 1758]
MTTGPNIEFVEEPSGEQVEAVLAILSEAAEGQRPGGDYRDYGFMLRDDSGAIVGGMTGYVLYDWMFVQFLSVAEQLRGQGLGEKLIDAGTQWGRKQGLRGMWLDTFAFQSPDFYRKLGFSQFGAIEDHPTGSRRIFFQKRFD